MWWRVIGWLRTMHRWKWNATAAQRLLFTELTMASSMSGRFKNGAMMFPATTHAMPR